MNVKSVGNELCDALAFGVLIVALIVVGSLLIMADLNASMMPAEMMNLHLQH